MAEVVDAFPRAWIEFPDPSEADQVIRADLTWLTSAYHCIYAQGCRGIDRSKPHAGCCTHGAHFADADDERRVATWVRRLTADQWQRRPRGRLTRTQWVDSDDEGERKTRTVAGACIFLNDPRFPAGPGCALHLLAASAGQSHIATKPDVCWQLPIRRDYHQRTRNDGTEVQVVTITEYTRDVWGAGGHDFDWYCTGNPDAHTAAEPLYLSSRAELRALIGEQAYAELAMHCEAHEAARAALRLSPVSRGLAVHPADPG